MLVRCLLGRLGHTCIVAGELGTSRRFLADDWHELLAAQYPFYSDMHPFELCGSGPWRQVAGAALVAIGLALMSFQRRIRRIGGT